MCIVSLFRVCRHVLFMCVCFDRILFSFWYVAIINVCCCGQMCVCFFSILFYLFIFDSVCYSVINTVLADSLWYINTYTYKHYGDLLLILANDNLNDRLFRMVNLKVDLFSSWLSSSHSRTFRYSLASTIITPMISTYANMYAYILLSGLLIYYSS